jgi:hypothetical protein
MPEPLPDDLVTKVFLAQELSRTKRDIQDMLVPIEFKREEDRQTLKRHAEEMDQLRLMQKNQGDNHEQTLHMSQMIHSSIEDLRKRIPSPSDHSQVSQWVRMPWQAWVTMAMAGMISMAIATGQVEAVGDLFEKIWGGK